MAAKGATTRQADPVTPKRPSRSRSKSQGSKVSKTTARKTSGKAKVSEEGVSEVDDVTAAQTSFKEQYREHG